MSFDKNRLEQINEYTWEIPKTYRKAMKVPARVYASQEMLDLVVQDKSLEQLVNIAMLPGVHKYALAMPDVHQGYGSPVGGVIGIDAEQEPIISPGMIGFDINCGVRVLTSNITVEKVRDQIKELAVQIQREVPSGLGRGHATRFSEAELDYILSSGPTYLVNERGIGTHSDLQACEESGRLSEANPGVVSPKAKQRGADQVGTLGSGNHFIELQEVVQIFEQNIAQKYKLQEGQLVAMIHTGSRGLGHQVASDFIKKSLQWIESQGKKLSDKELAYVPLRHKYGHEYWQAMAAAANFAWANRHMMGSSIRDVFQGMFGRNVKVDTLYDIAHNIAKLETHEDKKLLVHRKGATRSFPNQPVLIPGSMGTSSWILAGDRRSEKKSFSSACHGAGRTMSRTRAKKQVQGSQLKEQLQEQGVAIQAGSMAGLAEEAPTAYKDVDAVVETVHNLGLARKVAQLRPLAVIKG